MPALGQAKITYTPLRNSQGGRIHPDQLIEPETINIDCGAAECNQIHTYYPKLVSVELHGDVLVAVWVPGHHCNDIDKAEEGEEN